MSRTIQAPIKCEQLFSRKGLGYLWDNRESLDSSTVDIIKSLWRSKKTGSLQCKQAVEYRHSSSRFGKMGYGRLFSRVGVGLERLEKEARGTLCKEFYYDIDIVNCHPVLLVQYAKNKYNYALPLLAHYVEHRDEVLAKLSESRDEAKEMVIKILYGGKTDNYHLLPIACELQKFTRFLTEQGEHKELFEECKKEDNRYASFLSHLLQTEEVACMLAMKDCFENQGWSVDVLAYDGVMVRIRQDADLTEELLHKVEEDILENTGYKVAVVEKPMISFDIPKEEGKEDPVAVAYAAMKAKWEVNHFYFKPSNTIVEMSDDGHLCHYGIEHAIEAFNMWVLPDDPSKPVVADQPNFFLKKWRVDAKRRIVDTLVYKRPEDCKANEATLFCGFAYSKMAPCENPEAIAIFQDILRSNCGDDEVAYDYVLKWLARMIQNPFQKAGTAIYFINKLQGSGKDTIALWMKKLMGNHVAHYKKESDFFEKHDTKREGAVMVYLEEVGSGASKAHATELKAAISSDTIDINPKGTKGYDVPNMGNQICTTNNPDPVTVETSDRRYCLNYGTSRFVGKHEFWSKFYLDSKIDLQEPNPAWLYPVGKWLEGVDLTGYNVRTLPASEYKSEIAAESERSEESFIKQWVGLNVSEKELYDAYKDYCIEKSLPYTDKIRRFNKDLMGFPQYIIKKRVTAGVTYSSRGI